MSPPLKLYFHPLSSYSHKALTALYENGTPFEPLMLDGANEQRGAEFKALWPIGKFPVLRDDARNETVPESSIIIEYLQQHYPGKTRFIPGDPEQARKVRFWDRFFDLHLHAPMQKIVFDRIRPADSKDPAGVADAKAQIATALGIVEREIAGKSWAAGDAFSLADCAAGPPLFYINKMMPPADTYKHTLAYLDRLMQRPSYARALKEAEPYFHMLPS
jgi:glutathione S-transferase